MISRGKLERAAESLAVIATSGAAIVVPLLYVPSLALPFTLPKEIAFEIAGVLGYAAFGFRIAGRVPTQTRVASVGVVPPRPVILGAGILVLLSVLASGIVASHTAPGAPYGFAVLCRWAALFGLVCGVAATGGTVASRVGILQAATASAAVVSAIGLLQHVELLSLRIPVISAPGSTFGNRNLGAEAVALSIPLGLGALFSARTYGNGGSSSPRWRWNVCIWRRRGRGGRGWAARRVC